MATTENDILMQRKVNANTDIFYPVTRGENVLCDDGKTVEEKFNNVKSFSIATNAWTQSGSLYIATIVDNTVKATDMADIAIDSTTYEIAQEAGVKSYADEITGGIKLYADSIPTATITGKYKVSGGVANG